MDPVTHACPDPVDLESIITTAELNRRPPRPPEYEAENRALGALAQEMAARREAFWGSLRRLLSICAAPSRPASAYWRTNRSMLVSPPGYRQRNNFSARRKLTPSQAKMITSSGAMASQPAPRRMLARKASTTAVSGSA